LKPSPRSIGPAAPYPTGVHIPGIPPPAKFATEPLILPGTPDPYVPRSPGEANLRVEIPEPPIED
jgi:hypothetical protein